MHTTEKGQIINNINLKDITTLENPIMVKVLGSDRYKLFQKELIEVIDSYLFNVTNFNIDKLILKHMKNDEHAKYERFFEIGFSITGMNNNNKESQMDFVFEVFKVKDDPEACELLSYYMSEFNQNTKE